VSYDLVFYFPTEPSVVPTPRRGMQSCLEVDGPYAIDLEDIDESYRYLLGGCRYGLTVCCTGSRENFDDLDYMKNEILDRYSGVVIVDTQIGTALIEGKEIKYAAEALRKGPDAHISIYFEDGARFEAYLLDQFLNLLQHHVPEAMPHRYGSKEPLEYKLSLHGLDHFRDEWRKSPALAWQPKPPFLWVSTLIPSDRRDFAARHGAHSPFLRHYRCSLIQLRAKSNVCHEAAVLTRVRDFLTEAALLSDAFYSEVRTGSPQTAAWWWHGVPPGKPLVVIVGPPYLSLWQEFMSISQPLGAEHRLASTSVDATTDEITIPARLADPRDMTTIRPGRDEQYAPVFPFKRPQAKE
jgi:hypothetical protein